MAKITIELTPRQAAALATFIETGLSISPIIRRGDPDFIPMQKADDKLRAAIAAAKS